MLTRCSSIVTSRKRKLRELYAVATDEDGFPNYDLIEFDTRPASPGEAKFLFDCEILQYVLPIPFSGASDLLSSLHQVLSDHIWLTLGCRGRRLAERLLPVFQRPRSDTLQQHAATADDVSLGHGPHVVQQVQPSPLIHPNHTIPKKYTGLPAPPVPPTPNIRHEPERPVSYNPVHNGVVGPQETLKGFAPRQEVQKPVPVQGNFEKTVDGPSGESKPPARETPVLLAPAAPHGSNVRWNDIINNPPQGHVSPAPQPVATSATAPTSTAKTANQNETRPGPRMPRCRWELEKTGLGPNLPSPLSTSCCRTAATRFATPIPSPHQVRLFSRL